jgi:hypothetical protein
VRRGPQLNRYVAVIALLALGQDEVVADAVWVLAPEVTAVTAAFGMHKLRAAQVKDAPQAYSFGALYIKVPITTGR